jgi:hypothetical protein
MTDRRKYQRYVVDTPSQGEVKVDGELVQLVDFSLSGLCTLSKKPLSSDLISISVEFGNQGRIQLIGKVARLTKEGDMWRVAIDLTQTYKLGTLRNK